MDDSLFLEAKPPRDFFHHAIFRNDKYYLLHSFCRAPTVETVVRKKKSSTRRISWLFRLPGESTEFSIFEKVLSPQSELMPWE